MFSDLQTRVGIEGCGDQDFGSGSVCRQPMEKEGVSRDWESIAQHRSALCRCLDGQGVLPLIHYGHVIEVVG